MTRPHRGPSPAPHVTGMAMVCVVALASASTTALVAQPVRPMEAQHITTPNDTDIVITRTFDAPRERVFAALTEAARIRQWMKGPDITLESIETDVRVGGSSRQVFVRPSGRRLEVFGAYQEVQPPSRFVYVETYGFSPLRIVVTTTLEPAPGGTRFTQTIRYASKAERDADYPGVAESAATAHAELARYLRTSAP